MMSTRDIHERRAYALNRARAAVDRGALAETQKAKAQAAIWVVLWRRVGKDIPKDHPYFIGPEDDIVELKSPLPFLTRYTLRELIGRTDLGSGDRGDSVRGMHGRSEKAKTTL